MEILLFILKVYELMRRRASYFAIACLFCAGVLYIVINSSLLGIFKVVLVWFFFLFILLVIFAALESDQNNDLYD